MPLVDEGIKEFNVGRYAAALRLFRKALTSGEDGPRLRLFISHALRSLRKPKKASALGGAQDYKLRAWESSWKGRREAAKGFAAKALRQERTSSTQAAGGFCSFMRRGKFAGAFKEGERLLDAGATLTDVKAFWNPWGGIPVDAIRESQLELLDGLDEAKTPLPWLLYFRGLLREDERKWADFARLGKLAKGRYGWMNLKIGQHYLMAERLPEAVVHLKATLRHPPVNWWAYGFLAEALVCVGKEREALAMMKRADRAAPKSDRGSVLAWRGEIELWLGRYEEALGHLEASCAKGFSLAYCWRGAAVLKLGDPARGLKLLDEALLKLPDDREAHVWRAEARYRLGNWREALLDLDFEPVPFWAGVLRALVQGKLQGPKALKLGFQRLPEPIILHIRSRLGPKEQDEGSVLEGALRLAKGYRREDYGQRPWLSPTGVG